MKNPLSLHDIEKRLFQIVRDFLKELGYERASDAIASNAKLDNLGIGSLERARLFFLAENEFGVKLPESALINVISLHDLAKAIQEARPEKIKSELKQYAEVGASSIDPAQAETLIEVLQLFVDAEPERPHVYLIKDDGGEEVIEYGKLFTEAQKVAQGLIAYGVKPAETVAIMLPTCAEFFYGFIGTLLAGAIPVPIYPPFRPDQIEEYAKREVHILKNAEVRILITFQKAETLSKMLKAFIPSLKAVTTVAALQQKRKEELPKLQQAKHDSAMIQYTSGSTGNPKGVLLSHFNLLSNIRAYGIAAEVKPNDTAVSWLPLYHDMGLIGMWLGSLYYGLPVTIMSPLHFLSRPENWLKTIHQRRATLTGGPNFAYDLCVKRIRDEDIAGLDLSSLRITFNGAEAIYPNTIRSFTKRFEKYGLNPKAFLPVYGLAESSVALTFPKLNSLPRIDRIAREPYEREHRAIPFAADTKNSLEFVSCGKPLVNHEIRIIDDHGKELPERHVGNLYFRGPSSMQGYYRNPEATSQIYNNGWWNSGDLAYIAEGDVFITGRKKDIIIKAGRNIYPPEVEEMVNTVEGVRRGCAVAFGVKDFQQGTERFVVVAETNVTESAQKSKIKRNITEKISEMLGIPPDEVHLVAPRTIPKTSSGKLRRSAMLQGYTEGKIQKRKIPIWVQITKLFSYGLFNNIKKYTSKTAKIIYSSYAYLVFAIFIIPLWLVSYFISAKTTAKLIHFTTKLLLTLIGIPVQVSGKENLSKESCIYISNHASYIDTILLLSVLPPGTIFVGKKELLKVPVLKTFIKKLNFLMVNRLDFAQSIADAEELQNIIVEKKSILIFPEGTFTYATGLRPFKLGAFKISVETETPICPVALNGTRKVLRGDSHLLWPRKIKVHIGKLLMPKNKEWAEVINLRDKAKKEIAKHCGEPTLNIIRPGMELDKSE